MIKLILFTCVSISVTASLAAASCPANSSGPQCVKIERVVSNWEASEFKNVEVAVLKAGAPSEMGPCVYNEENSKVEIAEQAFQLTESAFSECMARAFVQARYSAVEERWAEHLGEMNAWIIQKGELTKVALAKSQKQNRGNSKFENTVARQVWMSLAAAELARQTQRALVAERDGQRSLASRDADEADLVRELLGLRR